MGKKTREKQINYIMKNYYGSDHTDEYQSNLSYLESLSDEELEKLYNSIL
jgi:hypothetical protein